MIQECGTIRVVGTAAIQRHLIGHSQFIRVFSYIGCAGVAECVKGNLARILDLLDNLRTMAAIGVLKAEHVAIGAPRFLETHDLRLQQLFDLVVCRIIAWMLGAKSRRARSRPSFAEDGLMENRLWQW